MTLRKLDEIMVKSLPILYGVLGSYDYVHFEADFFLKFGMGLSINSGFIFESILNNESRLKESINNAFLYGSITYGTTNSLGIAYELSNLLN